MIKGVRELPSDCFAILDMSDYIDGGHTPRGENAKWHISYYSDEDKNGLRKLCREPVVIILSCIRELMNALWSLRLKRRVSKGAAASPRQSRVIT